MTCSAVFRLQVFFLHARNKKRVACAPLFRFPPFYFFYPRIVAMARSTRFRVSALPSTWIIS